MSPTRVIPVSAVVRTRRAVVVSFLTRGTAVTSFVSRTPNIPDTLGLSPTQLGMLLLCLSGGSIVGLPLSGPIVHRVGPARAPLNASLTVTTGLVMLAAGLQLGIVYPVIVGLAFTGLGVGIWDVAMTSKAPR